MTFLFDSVVFGPVHSRRLGVSLGINLLPTTYKYCSFNCIYCECGWTKNRDSEKVEFPPAAIVKEYLEKKLLEMIENNGLPEAISFAGNGEPTLHPEFAEIIDITIELRNKYSPKSKIAVLSNATMLHLPEVVNALKKVDLNILKLDAGTEDTYKKINQPLNDLSLAEIVNNLKQFTSNLIIQTLFIRGDYNKNKIDNTTDEEIKAWLSIIEELKPKQVMIYPIARSTPAGNLEKISLKELEGIAEKVMKMGIKTDVYY
jgi:wyosine [tRNA(Phe)-imidazoG37] synthetase (radical SAM superfamily)